MSLLIGLSQALPNLKHSVHYLGHGLNNLQFSQVPHLFGLYSGG
jgi:hypothetical protein